MALNVSTIQAKEVPTSPRDIVHQWLQSYPHDLPQAVTLTSPEFRENLTQSKWIIQKESILNHIHMQYLNSQILKEEITGKRAVIEVKVLISTVISEQIQFKRYDLGRYCSAWLLEKVSVLEEWFLGHTM